VVERRWECPACKKQERTFGDVTFRRCPDCRPADELLAPVWMQLIEELPAPPKTIPVLAQIATP
jgi:hypothetical protein